VVVNAVPGSGQVILASVYSGCNFEHINKRGGKMKYRVLRLEVKRDNMQEKL
jgi:hypothetical protein